MTEKKKKHYEDNIGGPHAKGLKAMSDRENRLKRSQKTEKEDEDPRACA